MYRRKPFTRAAIERHTERNTKFRDHVFDPDEKVTGSGWWHWVVYNLPASIRSIAQGAGTVNSGLLPQGTIQGHSDLGTAAYHGPCPSIGEVHRYVITLYALNTKTPPVTGEATMASVRYVLNDFILALTVFSASVRC
jgi:Raf kinase inhibitor-like YbhB/YbcL family protein